jgi:LacI family repressor for deo operon, udp, cdd, tsx, nupC, and nupG
MKPSQAELARKLGISQRTVSSALHGSGRVGEATRRRIADAAERLGYRPDRLAAGLRGSRTSSLGIVWAFVDPWAGDASIALDITGRFQQRGFAIYQALNDEAVDILGRRIDDLLDRRIDALVVQATPDQLAHPAIRQRLAAAPAAVVVCREPVPGLPADQVVHDRNAAIHEVVDHLAAGGRRRPAMALAMRQESNPPKYQAFVERWAQHGVAAHKAMLIDLEFPEIAHLTGERHREAFRRQFPKRVPVDAVFCFNDTGALYVMRELQDRGLRVPEDVAVVGFNNDQAGPIWQPPLATGDRRPRDVAAAVCRLLDRRLAEPSAPWTTETVHMRFVWRASAGVPAPRTSETSTVVKTRAILQVL